MPGIEYEAEEAVAAGLGDGGKGWWGEWPCSDCWAANC